MLLDFGHSMNLMCFFVVLKDSIYVCIVCDVYYVLECQYVWQRLPLGLITFFLDMVLLVYSPTDHLVKGVQS